MANTNFKINNVDLASLYVPKEYVMDRYAELPDVLKAPTLWAWGSNGNGEVGDNTFFTRNSPVQTVAYGADWKQVAASGGHVAAIKTDGTLWLWGSNGAGQLGTNNTTSRSSPIQTVAGGTNWKQVSCGGGHTAAIKTDGTLWLWGNNNNSIFSGALGDGTTTDRSSPVQTVSGGTNWKQVSCGGGFTGAIKTDGTLWTWGSGWSGQLGDGTVGTSSRSSPIQTISGGTNWKQVACGSSSMAAIKNDGTLWAWGAGNYGALARTDLSESGSPAQTVAGGNNWKQVSGGYFGFSAIKTDGTLWMWGENSQGQLGTNDVVPRSSPVQTVAGGNNWYSIVCRMSAAAIKTDGTMWAWGFGAYGALGQGASYSSRSSPIQIANGGSNWKDVGVTDLGTGGGTVIAIRDLSSDMYGDSL